MGVGKTKRQRGKKGEEKGKREKERGGGEINYLLLLLHISLAERREERPCVSAIGVTQVSWASLGSPEK